jgi:hypothetical protein
MATSCGLFLCPACYRAGCRQHLHPTGGFAESPGSTDSCCVGIRNSVHFRCWISLKIGGASERDSSFCGGKPMTGKLPCTATMISLALASAGCYHHHLTTYGPVNLLPQEHKAVNAGWGGAIVPSAGTSPEKACKGQTFQNGMHVVDIDSNLGYAAISVITLGIASPVRVGWVCLPPVSTAGPTPSAARAGARAPTSGGGSTAKGSQPAEAPYTGRTLTSSVWGALQSDAKAPENLPVQPRGGPQPPDPPGPLTPANCHNYGMRQVRIRAFPWNYFYSLATLATAGFISPVRVDWQCAQAPDKSPTTSLQKEESDGSPRSSRAGWPTKPVHKSP